MTQFYWPGYWFLQQQFQLFSDGGTLNQQRSEDPRIHCHYSVKIIYSVKINMCISCNDAISFYSSYCKIFLMAYISLAAGLLLPVKQIFDWATWELQFLTFYEALWGTKIVLDLDLLILFRHKFCKNN